MATVYVGDIGVKIILNTTADISGAAVRKIYYKKPNGTTGNWAAAQESSTSISYTTAAGNLDSAGTWTLQAYVEKGAWKLYGSEASLTVNQAIA